MVQVIIDSPTELNKKIKRYMLDHNLTNKPNAIIIILEGALK